MKGLKVNHNRSVGELLVLSVFRFSLVGYRIILMTVFTLTSTEYGSQTEKYNLKYPNKNTMSIYMYSIKIVYLDST